MSIQQYKCVVVAAIGLFFSGVTHAEIPLYAVLMQSLSSPFWIAAEKGVKSGVDNAQADYYLQADGSADPQLQACNTMIERRPSIMLAAAISPNNLLPCLQRAKELNIPVVDLGGSLDHDSVKNAGGDIAFSVLSDDQSVGTQAADYISQQLNQDAGQILILSDTPGNNQENNQTTQRASGFLTQLSKICLLYTSPSPRDRG